MGAIVKIPMTDAYICSQRRTGFDPPIHDLGSSRARWNLSARPVLSLNYYPTAQRLKHSKGCLLGIPAAAFLKNLEKKKNRTENRRSLWSTEV